MMEQKQAYINYKKFAVCYDCCGNTFSYFHTPEGKILEEGRLLGGFQKETGQLELDLNDYVFSTAENCQEMDGARLTVRYAGKEDPQKGIALIFTLSDTGVDCRMEGRGDLDWRFTGRLLWGENMQEDTFAMSLDRQGLDLRSALGPAASPVDDLLFNRKTDAALLFSRYHQLRLSFDWEANGYSMRSGTGGIDGIRGFFVSIQYDVYARKFHVPYRAVNKQNTFPHPPSGWMTWYAVQFDASEETVLANARFQKEHLAPFGADTVWVDWEWYHSSFQGVGPENIHVFAPDPARYPHGMAYVAEEIKKLGFIPAIWIGATNEPALNDELTENPELITVQRPSWCGQYFLDLSNPKFYQDYIPKVFHQLVDWGYQAIKWDCLPITLDYADLYHDRWYNPALTPEEALRQVVAKARECVGENFYLLSCAGTTVRDITFALDLFDAARIGGDIFKWQEFLEFCIERVLKFYQYHNVVHYNDPDNVVLREEFNTWDQAVSRISFVALLGLPVTFGDDLTQLPMDRVGLLKRALPPLDIHPMDIRETLFDHKLVKTNLSVCREFESWNIVNLFNAEEEAKECRLDLMDDLHLEAGEYHVYDYWNNQYCGCYSRALTVSLAPCASRVLAVHRALSHPQILSTSRHITQGGMELEQVRWDAQANVLSGSSAVVAGDRYDMVLSVPAGYRPAEAEHWEELCPGIWRVSHLPEESGSWQWSYAFTQE